MYCLEPNAYVKISTQSKAISQLWTLTIVLTVYEKIHLQLRLSTPISKHIYKHTHAPEHTWQCLLKLLLLNAWLSTSTNKKHPYRIEYILLANRESEINQLSNDTNHVLVKRYERTQSSLDHNSISFINTKFLCMHDKNPIHLIRIAWVRLENARTWEEQRRRDKEKRKKPTTRETEPKNRHKTPIATIVWIIHAK